VRILPYLVSSKLSDISRGVIAVPSRKVGQPLPGMQAWYDAAVPSSFSITNGQVVTWADRSGNGFNLGAVQGDGSRPLYGGANLRTIGGISVPSADGNSRALYNASVPASDLTTTRYIVALVDVFTNNNVPLMSCFNEHNLGLHVADSAGTKRLVSQHVGTDLSTKYAFHDSAAVVAATPYVFSERRNTNAIRMGVNNVFESESWTPGSVGSNENGLYVFHCHAYRNLTPFDGCIGEILVYDVVHTDAEMNSVVAYLMGKWGIS
jgi:hypothetical protein